MTTNLLPTERRREPRVFLGVPVRVQLEGEPQSLTLELADISSSGGFFRTTNCKTRVGQSVAFGFVISDRSVCAARGTVVRGDDSGFALSLENTNSAFRYFIDYISSPCRRAA
jgi:hypothetical protein